MSREDERTHLVITDQVERILETHQFVMAK